MGLTIGEWKEYFKNLGTKELQHIIAALNTLSRFDVIKDEFDHTGLFILKALAELEFKSREAEQ